MNEKDEESLADWLFFARKQRHRRRVAHTTRTINTTNTQESNK